jgi:ATP-dependent RNA helicase RhlE
MNFQEMNLIAPLLQALKAKGYTEPTPIQEQTFKHVAAGKDVMGCAQTGTGKTAAFSLPIIQRLVEGDLARIAEAKRKGTHDDRDPQQADKPLSRNRRRRKQYQNDRRGPDRPIRSLILSPTRELAAQIGDNIRAYSKFTKLRHTVIFGGVRQGPQCRFLNEGIDILVATPGRLLDLKDQGQLSLKDVEIVVLDEADRMLDMGFMPDIKKIFAEMPDQRQTLMYSATMPRDIRRLADAILTEPEAITIKAESPAAETVRQAVYFVDYKSKLKLLIKLLGDPSFDKTLVFSRTKRGADRIAEKLSKSGVSSEAIHSDRTQAARMRALKAFKNGKVRVLVGTDIAARGIDVNEISHVFNYDMAGDSETYIHRIGRTGRAGAEGDAVSFCMDDEHDKLRDVEKLIGRKLIIQTDELAQGNMPSETSIKKAAAKSRKRGPRGGGRSSHASRGGRDDRNDRGNDRGRSPRSGSGARSGSRSGSKPGSKSGSRSGSYSGSNSDSDRSQRSGGAGGAGRLKSAKPGGKSGDGKSGEGSSESRAPRGEGYASKKKKSKQPANVKAGGRKHSNSGGKSASGKSGEGASASGHSGSKSQGQGYGGKKKAGKKKFAGKGASGGRPGGAKVSGGKSGGFKKKKSVRSGKPSAR